MLFRSKAPFPRCAGLAQQLGDQILQRIRRTVILIPGGLIDQSDLARGGQRLHDLHAVRDNAASRFVQRAVDGGLDDR